MKLPAQLFRFGIVGVLAMLMHLAIVSVLVPLQVAPLLANVAAFIIAFQISYYGHRSWTFRARHEGAAYWRLLLVSGISFLLNEILYALLLKMSGLDYRASLAIVLVTVSAFTFIASRLWVFREMRA